MTADTPARVSDQWLEMNKTGYGSVSVAVAEIVAARVLTQAQAERIAALEAEVAQSGEWIRKLDAERIDFGHRALAAESSLAASQAVVEGLAEALRGTLRVLRLTYSDELLSRMTAVDDAEAALAALPEAKPAVQEGE